MPLNTEKDKTRMLLNSPQMKAFEAWLTEDLLFRFEIKGYAVCIWKTWWFITVSKLPTRKEAEDWVRKL